MLHLAWAWVDGQAFDKWRLEVRSFQVSGTGEPKDCESPCPHVSFEGTPEWGPPEVRRGSRQEVKALDGEPRAGCFPQRQGLLSALLQTFLLGRVGVCGCGAEAGSTPRSSCCAPWKAHERGEEGMEVTDADGLHSQRPCGQSSLATKTSQDPATCRRQPGCQDYVQVFLSTHQSPPYSVSML